MVFTTTKFLTFFIVLFIAFYIAPKKHQWIFLLLANLYFYLSACKSPFMLSYIILATVISYATAILIDNLELEKNRYFYKNNIPEVDRPRDQYAKRIDKKKKGFLKVGVILTLSFLVVLKYTDFLVGTSVDFLNLFGLNLKFKSLDLLMPLGISFYTFMSVGYMIDVCKTEYKAERNIFKYFTFVSFFPHVLQGPIDTYGKVQETLFKEKEFNYNKSLRYFYRIAIGVFKKLVVADKLAVVVSMVTGNVNDYYGFTILGTMILYAMELYADFSGYMDIAIGCAGVLGVEIDENFNSPYFSKTIAEFWRRWHISLNQWFVKYIYIPLGGNRKGELKKLRNVFIIFFVSGLWHGANLSYVLWGIYHGIVMVIANVIKPYCKDFASRFKVWWQKMLYSMMQMTRTFMIVVFGYFFLSVENVSISFNMIKNMFMFSHTSETLRAITSQDCKVSIVLGLIIIGVLDLCKYYDFDILKKVQRTKFFIRWTIYLIFMFIIVMLSAGEAQEFLYFKF